MMGRVGDRLTFAQLERVVNSAGGSAISVAVEVASRAPISLTMGCRAFVALPASFEATVKEMSR